LKLADFAALPVRRHPCLMIECFGAMWHPIASAKSPFRRCFHGNLLFRNR
jgi:hypothetical protein